MAGGGELSARLVLSLEGNVDAAAKSQAQALDAVRDSMKADTEEVANLRKALGILKGTTGSSADEAKKLKEQLIAKRESVASSQAKYLQLGGTLDQLFTKQQKEEQANQKSTKGLVGLRAEITKVSPTVTKLSQQFTAMQAGWIASAASLALLVGSIAALTGGTIAAATALTHYGLAAGDAARNERLMLEGLVRSRGALQGSEQMAFGFQKAIDRVAADVPLARAEVADLSKELWGMRLRGDALENMLRGMALAKSVGANFWALGYATNATGQSMLNLAKIAEQRFGPVVAKQMFSISVQSMKLREQMRSLFAGVDVAPLGMAMKRVTDSFRESSVVGWELRRALENLFGPLIGDAGKAGDLIPAVMTKLTIKALELESYLMDLAISAKKWWMAGGDESSAAKARILLGDLKVIAEGLAVALKAAASAAQFFLSAFTIPEDLFSVEDASLNAEAKARASGELVAKSYATGLATGQTVVAEASTALAIQSAVAFQKALQMHSPSRVMFDLGFRAGTSIAPGLRAAAPEVSRAAASLVEPRALAIPSMAGYGGQNSRRGVDGPVTVNIYAPTGTAQEIAGLVKSTFENLLEGIVVQIGASPQPQGAF
jgi:hypothetical protein